MELDLLYTNRKYESRFFFDLVYEWEDVLMRELDLKFFHSAEEWYEWGG